MIAPNRGGRASLHGNRSAADPGNSSYRDAINAARRDLVVEALSRTNGNRAAAARLLDLETKYFLRLMKSLGIE